MISIERINEYSNNDTENVEEKPQNKPLVHEEMMDI